MGQNNPALLGLISECHLGNLPQHNQQNSVMDYQNGTKIHTDDVEYILQNHKVLVSVVPSFSRAWMIMLLGYHDK